MAITEAFTGFTSGNETSQGTTAITNTTGATIPAGTTLVISAGWDNTNATNPTASLGSVGGSTPNARINSVPQGASATAGSGVFLSIWTVKTVSDIANNATIGTITWSVNCTGKRWAVLGFADCNDALRGTAVTNGSTSGAPSIATGGTAPVTGDIVIGAVVGENSAAPTADNDTTNGSWSTQVGGANTGGAAATNVSLGTQYKIVTAGGSQTYDPSVNLDTIAGVFALTPAAVTQSVDADFDITATLSTEGQRTQYLGGTLTATATLSAAGDVQTSSKEIAGTLAVTATLASAGLPTRQVAGGLSVTATLTADEIVEHTFTGSLSATVTLTAGQLLEHAVAGGLSVTAALASELLPSRLVAGSLDITAGFTAAADVQTASNMMATAAATKDIQTPGTEDPAQWDDWTTGTAYSVTTVFRPAPSGAKPISGGLLVTASLSAAVVSSYVLDGTLEVNATLTSGVALEQPLGGVLAVTTSLSAGAVPEYVIGGVVAITATTTAEADVSGQITLAGVLAATATLSGAITQTSLAGGTLSVTATLGTTAEREAIIGAALATTASLSSEALLAKAVGGDLVIVVTLGAQPTIELVAGGVLSAITSFTADISIAKQVISGLSLIATLVATAESLTSSLIWVRDLTTGEFVQAEVYVIHPSTGEFVPTQVFVRDGYGHPFENLV